MPTEPLEPLLHRCAEGRVERAKTVAFALVSVYDHEIADDEVTRYGELIGGDAEAFRALAKAMKAGLDDATEWAREELKKSRDVASDVAHAARVAVISDNKLRPREEVALHIVALALGLDPDEV